MDMIPPDWLSKDAIKIYNATLPKIKDVTPDKLHMLEAYAHCASEFHRFENDKSGHIFQTSCQSGVADLWRRGMIFARNGLGIAPPVHISFVELLLDDGWNEMDSQNQLIYLHRGEVIFHLDYAWQFGKD